MDLNQNPIPEVSLYTDVSQVSQLMTTSKGKKKIIGALIVLVIIISLSFVLIYVNKNSKTIKAPILTEAERKVIIDSLEKSAVLAPKVTDEEKRTIINSLSKSSAAAPVLTPAERQAIIDSLPQ